MIKEIANGIMDIVRIKGYARIDLKDIRKNLKDGGMKATKENMDGIIEIITNNGHYEITLDSLSKCYRMKYVY